MRTILNEDSFKHPRYVEFTHFAQRPISRLITITRLINTSKIAVVVVSVCVNTHHRKK